MPRTNAAIAALRDLLRNRGRPLTELGRHFTEATHKGELDDRLLAVVCGAAIEEALQSLLESSMENGSGTLFEPQQPLATFSAKIAIAYSFGKIDTAIRRNADYIRHVRNAFSHRVAPIDFKTKEVAAVCKLLAVNDSIAAKVPGFDRTAKSRFFWATLSTLGAIMGAVSEDYGVDGIPESSR